jgi:methionyl-tRNA synthetase
MLAAADALADIARGHMKAFHIHLYIGAAMDVIGAANRYFANAEPWRLAKSDPERMRTVLYVTLEILRIAGILLQPVMPSAMTKLLDLLAVPTDRRTFAEIEAGPMDGPKRLTPGVALPPPAAIFPRYAES